jgi:hypothetical protein
MQHQKRFIGRVTAGLILVICATIIWLESAVPANAQCGSQASSCKNCHEVQGEKPVNQDGTAWHQSHAFGDFCYICHAGNNQAQDETAAHTSMVSPLSDVKAACMQCHVSDYMDRAQVYATTLGVEIDGGTSSSTSGDTGSSTSSANTGSAGQTSAESSIGIMASTELDVNDPNLMDYVERYNALVLGEHPTNWGNVILAVLVGIIGLGGGTFVLYNEGWTKMNNKEPGEYPADLTALLPKIAHLSPPARKKLQRILDDPDNAEATFSKIQD